MPVPYYIPVENASITNANGDYDLLELTLVDEGPIEIVGFEIVSFELGDAQDEWFRIQWFTDNTTTGNGTATTVRPVDQLVTHANPPTAETIASAPATGGTAIPGPIHSVSARGGTNGPIWFPSGFGPKANQADTLLVMRLLAAVTDDIAFSGTWYLNVGI